MSLGGCIPPPQPGPDVLPLGAGTAPRAESLGSTPLTLPSGAAFRPIHHPNIDGEMHCPQAMNSEAA